RRGAGGRSAEVGTVGGERKRGSGVDQHVWANGDDSGGTDGGMEERRKRRERRRLGLEGADRERDGESGGVYLGRARRASAGGSERRDLSGRGGAGTRVLEESGTDGGEICAASICGERGRTAVPDRGSGEVSRGWDDRICGAGGSTGEGTRLPDRTRGKRGGPGRGGGGGGGRGGDEGG